MSAVVSPPAHLVVPGTERHGVTVLARQLAAACGARVVDLPDLLDVLGGAGHEPPERVHLHLTDRLLGATPRQAAAVVERLARRTHLTVTLHDVPQPTDGDGFERRRTAYADVLGAVAGWVVSSATERATVERHCAPTRPGGVVPLPVRPPRTDLPAPAWDGPGPVAAGDAELGVFGWVYPGKGHADALAAAALLGDSPGTRPRVVALGAVAEGSDWLADRLAEQAATLGVRWELTGWLDDEAADRRLAAVTVGVAGHVNVSASGSVNSWLAVGRRPLVRAGDYTREMHALRPGTLELVSEGGPEALAAALRGRLAEPRRGLVGPEVAVRPTPAQAAAAYGAWWAAP